MQVLLRMGEHARGDGPFDAGPFDVMREPHHPTTFTAHRGSPTQLKARAAARRRSKRKARRKARR